MTTNFASLPEEVDGIFIGGDHNNLVAANYLGRAGARVLVLESQSKLGGGLASEEITLPLFKHNLHAYFVRWTPDYRIWSDLQPSRYGLETFVPDIQNRHVPSMLFGNRHHGMQHPNDFFANRPDPRLSSYRTPIEGLYLTGAGTHPGGSFTGQPGYNAATVIAQELGYDLWWKPRHSRDVLAEL